MQLMYGAMPCTHSVLPAHDRIKGATRMHQRCHPPENSELTAPPVNIEYSALQDQLRRPCNMYIMFPSPLPHVEYSPPSACTSLQSSSIQSPALSPFSHLDKGYILGDEFLEYCPVIAASQRLSELACSLNEIEEGVAPTDSQLRPNQWIARL